MFVRSGRASVVDRVPVMGGVTVRRRGRGGVVSMRAGRGPASGRMVMTVMG
jgi:hypothetical protein